MRTEEDRSQIVEVWADNLESEFRRIEEVVEEFPYIALDTEFPGIVAKPSDTAGPEYNYRTVKCNVDLLKVIQLGITFADAAGNVARNPSTWQFNFRFDMGSDMYAQDSIDFLRESGVDFERLQRSGIEFNHFGELMISSGLVMNDDVRWISFHGCYDFGYLLKLLTCTPLPESEERFFELLTDFFPALYDIKFLLKSSKIIQLMGGNSLQRLAEHFNVQRVGRQHQAGSDSLVTCRTFFKLVESYFGNQIDDSRYSGVIYGLGCFGNKRCVDLDENNDDSASEMCSQQRNGKKNLESISLRDNRHNPTETVLAADQAIKTSITTSIYGKGILRDTQDINRRAQTDSHKFDEDPQRTNNAELKVYAR